MTQITKPMRLKRRRSKGWRKPANAVIVDRTTRWGNPFETAGEFEWALMHVINETYSNNGGRNVMNEDQWNRMKHIADHLWELTGRDLVCWCDPDKKCHADVLIEWANA